MAETASPRLGAAWLSRVLLKGFFAAFLERV